MQTPKTAFRSGFVQGFVVAALLASAGVVLALGELYTPSTTWIQDAMKYAPGTSDQVNVLADLQPGKAEIMFDVGLRMNALNSAGKKQNWGLAEHQIGEIEEAFDRLMVTRPELTTDLEAFLTTSLAPVYAAVTAPTPDKAVFKTALADMVTACNTCHTTYGEDFLTIKLGKTALPLE